MRPLKKYPIVMITGLDHAIETSGMVTKYNPFAVFGVLYKETASTYIICQWVYGGQMTEDNNVTSSVVKHPGMKKKVIGWVAFK